MLIIINDDPAYVSWLSRHRQGYVLDTTRKPAKRHLVLHRATCSAIKPHKRARLTTGAHLKACSLSADELNDWAREQVGVAPLPCPQCQPDQEPPSQDQVSHALTRLGKEVVSYVLDLAVMYLDGEEWRYRPDLAAISTYLDKTPKQLLPALKRLIEEGYLQSDPPPVHGEPSSRAIVYPTARSLRTIPAYDAMSAEALSAELARLRGNP